MYQGHRLVGGGPDVRSLDEMEGSDRHQVAVAQADAFAASPARRRFLGVGSGRPIVQAYGDLVALFGAVLPFRLIARVGAAQSADNGGDVAAVALADLFSEQAADDAPGDGAETAALGRRADFADRFDDAAIVACRNRRAGGDDIDADIVGGRVGRGRGPFADAAPVAAIS